MTGRYRVDVWSKDQSQTMQTVHFKDFDEARAYFEEMIHRGYAAGLVRETR